jgi:membrane-associated phospholipid phosphatase
VLTELLLICYYGYFLWPLLLGVVLYLRGQRHAYQHYTLALALTFVGTFIGYIWVPAVGPRFFLASFFMRPLQGVWLTPLLDSAMRNPTFMRDCFPSGHTAITLVVLAFAYRYLRPFFWAVLPACTGLIAATLVGRFHYGVDLLCAVPLAVLTGVASSLVVRARLIPDRPYAPTPLWNRSSGELA